VTPRERRLATERGQTLPDFVVAVGIFLLVIAFVVSFVPQMTAPYDDQEHPVVADRIASDLVGDLLADPDSPSGLDEECTVAFLTDYETTGCAFEDGSLTGAVGTADRYSVNVTIQRTGSDGDHEVLRADGGSIDDSGTERLARGPTDPDDGTAIATARRTVHFDGADALLEVKVWTR